MSHPSPSGDSTARRIDARFVVDYPGFSLDVDLALPGHGVTALFGPSGSGKTTVLRCMAGLEAPARGHLRVGGETWFDTNGRIDLPTHRRPIGYVFQEASLFPHLDVRGNLAYGMKRIARAARRVKLDDVAAMLGIDHLLERMPIHLSGGERQRVGIARALLKQAPIIVFDEATSALDTESEIQVQRALVRLMQGRTVIAVAHRLSTLAEFDRVLVLHEGRIVEDGPPGLLSRSGGIYQSMLSLQADGLRTSPAFGEAA